MSKRVSFGLCITFIVASTVICCSPATAQPIVPAGDALQQRPQDAERDFATQFRNAVGDVGCDQPADIDGDGWVNAVDVGRYLSRQGKLSRHAEDGRGGPIPYRATFQFQAADGLLSQLPVSLPLSVRNLDGAVAGYTLDIRLVPLGHSTGILRFADGGAPNHERLLSGELASQWSVQRVLENGARTVVNFVNSEARPTFVPQGTGAVTSPKVDLRNVDCGEYRVIIGGCTAVIDDLGMPHAWNSEGGLLRVERPSGDINHDGVVDAIDVTLVADSVGSNAIECDLNGDGFVDSRDQLLVGQQLGQRGSWSFSSAIPESRLAACDEQLPFVIAGTMAGNRYLITREAVTYATAASYAQRMGAYLASITSEAENSFISNLAPMEMWIGLRVNHQGNGCGYGNYSLAWDSGEPAGYTSWGTNCEPNNLGGNESRVTINTHRAGGWNDINPTYTAPGVIEFRTSPEFRITSPVMNASPRSQLLAVQGTCQPGHSVLLRLLDRALFQIVSYPVQADSEGYWEKVFGGSLAGCAYIVIAEDQADPTIHDLILVNNASSGGHGLPAMRYDLLRTGDVFTSYGSAAQTTVYGASWSHAAIYAGADPDGTPAVSEAAITSFSWRHPFAASLGEVRTLPLDDSDVGLAFRAQVWRLNQSLSWGQRLGIAAKARSYAGTPYWAIENFAEYVSMSHDWSPTTHLPYPIFQRDFDVRYQLIRAQVDGTDRFICSTLVRRVYLDQMGVDLAGYTPINGGVFGDLDPAYRVFIATEGLWVVPDSIAASTQLIPIN